MNEMDKSEMDRKSEQDRLMDKFIYPDGDPAIINPEELASFPKPSKNNDYNIEAEKDNHSVTKPSPVRSGRNITQTGLGPNKEGFM
jgi:hypothetical protein